MDSMIIYLKRGLKSARMRDTLYNLPKAIAKIRNPPLAPIEKIEDSYEDVSNNLEGQGVEKTITPPNIIDNYTRLEILVGLKSSGQTSFLPEASNLIDELHKRGELQNEQQYGVYVYRY